MDRIASFKVNHLKLKKGLYVSRQDEKNGVKVTTFDLRVTTPYLEPVMDNGAIHTIEHIFATFLRNSERKEDIVYFGPMGCRTGFYLITFGDLKPQDVLPLVLSACDFLLNFDGEIMGASKIECGNYLEQNLDMAKYYISRYKNALLSEKNFEYKE